MNTIGIDQGAPGGDKTTIAQVREGTVSICTVPEALGRVTALREQNGKVIAETESGTPLIIPVR